MAMIDSPFAAVILTLAMSQMANVTGGAWVVLVQIVSEALRSLPFVTATQKPPINAAIATIGTDPAARKCASSKQSRNSERSALQR